MEKIFCRTTFVLVILLLCVLHIAVCQGQEILPSIDLEKIEKNRLSYSFETITNLRNADYHPIDMDYDGIDEFVSIKNHSSGSNKTNFILITDIETKYVLFDKPYNGRIRLSSSSYDLENDGMKELIISEVRADTSFVHIINSKGEDIFTYIGAVKPDYFKNEWDCPIITQAIMDINGDSYSDVLMNIQVGRPAQPRGIFALDVHNKNRIWEYETGFVPRPLQLIDIDGDGHREILFGSDSPNNGKDIFGSNYTVNGTDDSHVYISLLDSLGHHLGKPKIVGGEHACLHLYTHDLTGDSNPEVLVIYTSSKKPKESSYIAFWNPLTGNIGPKIYIEKDLKGEVVFLDADRDGKDDILMSWSDGSLEFRNQHLEIIRSRLFMNYTPERVFVTDMDNDSEEDIIITGQFEGRSVSAVIDRQLRLLAYDDSELTINDIVNTGFGKRKWILGSRINVTQDTYLLELRKRNVFLSLLSWKWPGFVCLAGMFIMGILMTIIFMNKIRHNQMATMNMTVNIDKTPSLLLDSKGAVLKLNNEMEHLLNRIQKDIHGQYYYEIFQNLKWDSIAGVIKSAYQQNLSNLYQESCIELDGERIDVLVYINSIPLSSSKQIGKIVKIQNITDLVQSKRAVAWATIAQRLAHEIKTPLSTVMLSAQRLQMKSDSQEEGKEATDKYIDRILKQVGRLRKITDTFLKFSRIEKPIFERVHINQMILNWLKDNKIRLGPNIRVEKNLSDELPAISADKQQIGIVLQNIIDNSIDAMKGKGVLTVTTRLVQSLHKYSTGLKGDGVQIEIIDTGKGISKEDMKQLFRPFFSKSAGGTGLGLVISKKIVEDHSGFIGIESEENVGTMVTITLPVTRKKQ